MDYASYKYWRRNVQKKRKPPLSVIEGGAVSNNVYRDARLLLGYSVKRVASETMLPIHWIQQLEIGRIKGEYNNARIVYLNKYYKRRLGALNYEVKRNLLRQHLPQP